MERYPEDDELDQEALLQQLGSEGPDFKEASDVPASGQPTSNTMPIGSQLTEVRPTLPDEKAPAPAVAVGGKFQGFTPKHAMEGFDFAREQDTGKSAKDAFAYLANRAPAPPLNDKAALGAWFTQYIKPGMDALGHTVSSVDGDKFRFKNWQGEYDVDYGRGAGADGGALAWQVDDGTAQNSNAAYTPQTVALPAGAGPSAQDEIMAEVEALINGGNSPMDERALMELLQQEQI